MNENVLREFLVSIGFKVDEHSFKKFTSSLDKVTKDVMHLGKMVAASATAVVAGTTVIANQMEKLYYASQRTGSTVSSLMALRYAAGQIGLTAEQAQGALENFTRTIRLNPGMNALLGGLGVKGKDPSERFQSFIGKMKGMQPAVAAMYASMFGIDPDTLLMLENGLPKLEAEEDKYKKRLRAFGLDPEKLGEDSKNFSNKMRQLYGDFEMIGLVIESKVLPVLGPMVDRFEHWLELHAQDIANAIADGIERIGKWIASVDWDKFEKNFNGILDSIGGIKTVMIALAAIQLAPIIGGVLSLTSAIIGLAGAASSAGAATGAAAGAGTAVASGGLIARLFPFLAKVGVGATLMLHSEELNSGEDAQMDLIHRQQAEEMQAKGLGKVPRGIRNNNPGNIKYGDFAISMGATGADPDGFAIFPSMEAGRAATMALLKSYQKGGFNTISKIINRWAPSSENNTSAYIADVSKRLGVSGDSQLDGSQLTGVAAAIIGHENGASYSKLGTGGASPGGQSVSQTNNINVTGSSNPHQTAAAVGSEVRRANGDLVRNLSPAAL